MFLSMWYPCASINNLLHRTLCAMSSTPTSLASHVLRVLSFCLLDALCIAPSPIVITALVCDLKSGWTAKLVSMYHLMTCKLSALNVITSSLVPLIYCIIQTNLSQLYVFGFLTRVDSTKIVVPISGRPHLVANIPCAVKVLKS